jgi:hypothetical protein
LLVGLTPAERVKPHGPLVEIDFGTDEPVWPPIAHYDAVAEQLDGARVGRAAEVDDTSAQRSLEVECPLGRESATSRRPVGAIDVAVTMRADIGLRASSQRCERSMVEPRPHLRLPAAVVALDEILKAMLARCREHGRDAKTEAQASDATKAVSVLMGALKARVVVELRIAWEAELAPMLDEKFNGRTRGDSRRHPRRNNSTVQADSVEYLDFRAAFDGEAHDRIEAVELGSTRGDVRQVPALRRSGPAYAR